MFYSENFKEKCKKLYPDSIKLHEMLETGNENVGRYLEDSIPKGFTFCDVLTANSLEELKAKALIGMEKMEICVEWHSLYEEQHNK